MTARFVWRPGDLEKLPKPKPSRLSKRKPATEPASAESAESECRDALGPERFEHLAAVVAALPETINRRAYFTAITAGVMKCRGWRALDPEWCRDRDDALAAVKRAIKGLKVVLRRSPWASYQGRKGEFVETWAGGLEREFRRLTEAEVLDGGQRTVPFLRLSRVRLGWVPPAPRGGRPRETWKTETAAALRALGCDRHATLESLKAAGLIVED